MSATSPSHHDQSGPVPLSRGACAASGARTAAIAWPVVAILVLLIGLIGCSGKPMEEIPTVFLFMVFGIWIYGLPAWPIVLGLAAAAASTGDPARLSRSRSRLLAWIVAAVCGFIVPLFIVLLD
ncbi:hypothetical protein [Amycolatopsis nigrescens]|uniref:hypothetical protein n=1 Tax=Amycolatopsis nigrescens TaxID=381445 RepID=UPI00036A8164|nr:hypothetical protein [Amycolatopsis nigrescens]